MLISLFSHINNSNIDFLHPHYAFMKPAYTITKMSTLSLGNKSQIIFIYTGDSIELILYKLEWINTDLGMPAWYQVILFNSSSTSPQPRSESYLVVKSRNILIKFQNHIFVLWSTAVCALFPSESSVRSIGKCLMNPNKIWWSKIQLNYQ